MALISDGDKKIIKEEFFSKLINPVKIIVFTGKEHCQYCDQLKQLVEEIGKLSNLISYEVHDFDNEKELAEKYRIDRAPATVITQDGKDLGVRYFGLPAGHEFGSFLEDIVDVSRGETDLEKDTKEAIRSIEKDVEIYVFVTPTCPYCPIAVRTAHHLAIENEKIVSDMIEALEFPHLASRYQVMAVPKIVINDKISFEGAVPEHVFVDYVLAAIKS